MNFEAIKVNTQLVVVSLVDIRLDHWAPVAVPGFPLFVLIFNLDIRFGFNLIQKFN